MSRREYADISESLLNPNGLLKLPILSTSKNSKKALNPIIQTPYPTRSYDQSEPALTSSADIHSYTENNDGL